MYLPKKDSNGRSYLSYSQITCFKNSESDYYERYILKKPFEGNAYTEFGSKVGEALENNNFNQFTPTEQGVLRKVTRLDEFERKVSLNYEGFYVMGFIDTNSLDLKTIIDYKTGGPGKEAQYSEEAYTQLPLYALALRQETGVTPERASVEFIRRDGNAFNNELLSVGDQEPIHIEVDISIERLQRVYARTYKIAREIEAFYLKHK